MENVYSQYGEDGIIRRLLDQIGRSPDPFCIEFGAANGFFCSNTAALWHDQGWEALLIEADLDLYEVLHRYNSQRVNTSCARVSNIDDFTTRVADVCSIDVDGDDWHIFSRMQTRHRIVLVEHNPTVPPHVRMVGEEGTPQGSSALSLVELAKTKGYVLAAATTCNVIFVRAEEGPRTPADLEEVFDRSCLNYVVTDYQGGYDFVGRWPYGRNEKRDFDLRQGV